MGYETMLLLVSILLGSSRGGDSVHVFTCSVLTLPDAEHHRRARAARPAGACSCWAAPVDLSSTKFALNVPDDLWGHIPSKQLEQADSWRNG